MSPQQQEPRTIDGRYALSDEVRSGGMSTVTRAFDLQDHTVCAIKRMIKQADQNRMRESFDREYAALSELSAHSNIVSLLDVGSDKDGPYLVLEWMPKNLDDLIKHRGPTDWKSYYETIGRPILNAIVFAQTRGWHHRDIKPANILLTEDEVPKISDYGISRHESKPGIGLTFSAFRSTPFSPPEDDAHGEWSGTRDCFSWAAVTVAALRGLIPDDYGLLREYLAGISHADAPVQLLESALSDAPSERPILASQMQAEIDQWELEQSKSTQPRQTCYLRIQQGCLNQALRLLNASDRTDAERYFREELNEAAGIQNRSSDRSQGWRVFAVTWTFDMVRDSNSGQMMIARAWPSSPSEVERRREIGFRPAVTFSFGFPPNVDAASSNLDEIFSELEAFESLGKAENESGNQDRIFRVWYSFLRAKSDFEARREEPIPYVDYKINQSNVVFTTSNPVSAEIIGQSRVIKLTTLDSFFCEVVDVSADQIIVSISLGDAEGIPRRGMLEFNTIAAERAIDRQRMAVDAINYDRAVSVGLKHLIVNPQTAAPPSEPTGLKFPRSNFDDEKRNALSKALGLKDALAIQGPPGTGKTRLIEEIIIQYTNQNPTHRILLSSQTHVALDNVIERVLSRSQEIEIVRIGKLDDPRISNACQDLILDRKTEMWSQQVVERASSFLTEWSEVRGIARNDVEVGLLAERLIRLRVQASDVENRIALAESQVRELEAEREKKLSTTGSTDTSSLDTEARIAQEDLSAAKGARASIELMLSETRERLRSLGGYGPELADGATDDLSEWSSLLLGDSELERKCRQLLELHEDWILRVGRSAEFHAAILSSAQVVAGTCVGVAGVRGMSSVSYDLCIIDEASKATATEILVPMSRSRKWILVGDPAQLPPFFEDEAIRTIEEFNEEEIRETILDRFLRDLPDNSIVRLKNQYRMVRPIGNLISECFYDGQLNSPNKTAEIVLTGAFPKPVTWLSTSEFDDRYEKRHGNSYNNDREIQIIRDVLKQINFIADKRNERYDIAVIAGYLSQSKLIQDGVRDYLHEWTSINMQCNTVDAFQGNEADICIYSVTRSNVQGRLGFLREKPRLNVALSRGRSALIVVGDDDFCRSAEGENPFRRVLEFIASNPETSDLRLLK